MGSTVIVTRHLHFDIRVAWSAAAAERGIHRWFLTKRFDRESDRPSLPYRVPAAHRYQGRSRDLERQVSVVAF